MLPVLKGVIARRVLINYRVEPEVLRPLIPAPLELLTHNGYGVAGVCLIRLEKLRPRGLPEWIGFSAENMAHRVAIRFPGATGMRDGVFIWRRETDRKLLSLLGGRLFPGVHGHAAFQVDESENSLAMMVSTTNHEADVRFTARYISHWPERSIFESLEEASEFFERGGCGFSCGLNGNRLEGLWLRTLDWSIAPLGLESVQAAFFDDPFRFPEGTVRFDNALLMRGVRHEGHRLENIPELAWTGRR